MEVRGASFCVAKAMFCPRMLLTMMVIGDCVAASIVAGCVLYIADAETRSQLLQVAIESA
jgi:hypothetical protein